MGHIIYLYKKGLHNKSIPDQLIPNNIEVICSEHPFPSPFHSITKFLDDPLVFLGLSVNFLCGKALHLPQDTSSLRQICKMRNIPFYDVDASTEEILKFSAASFFPWNWAAFISLILVLIYPILVILPVLYVLLVQTPIAIDFRNKTMVEKTLKIMEQTKYQKVLLYSGNAHVKGISHLLQSKNVQVKLV